MSANKLRLALISDIHAYSKHTLASGENAPSFVEVTEPGTTPGQNPFVALKQLITVEDLSADVLISCGDMGDKAQPEAIRYAWDNIRSLRTNLSATEIIAVSGNHDLDSRLIHSKYDARGTLLELSEFPFPERELVNEFWARNVVVVEGEYIRWVVLNSSAYHGYKDEYQHGRIAESTLSYLRERLAATSSDKVNILVLHHHVYKIGNIDLEDYSEMTLGSALLSLLEGGSFGSWLIFHGHRHWPSLTYAPGGNNSPVVFAAGSLSAILWDELTGRARNQFYIVEIEVPAKPGRIRGTFRAWDFTAEVGFVPAGAASGLPHQGGFGGSLSGIQLAAEIAIAFNASGAPFLPWQQALAQIADLKYTLPSDLLQCIEHLKRDHGLTVLQDDGAYEQIGRKR